MNKELLISLIDKGLSVREMISYTEKSYSNIRYWLKKYDIKTKRTGRISKIIDDKKFCKICKKEKHIDEFYKNKKREKVGINTYCKKCSNLYHQNRVKDVKIKMINYKGGKCEDCNLKLENSHYSVYDFHHLDPLEKDSNFGKIKYQKWNTIEKEIDKCKLLCANCHRLEHAKLGEWGKSEKIVESRNEKIEKYCDCGIKINITSKRCKKCYDKELKIKIVA